MLLICKYSVILYATTGVHTQSGNDDNDSGGGAETPDIAETVIEILIAVVVATVFYCAFYAAVYICSRYCHDLHIATVTVRPPDPQTTPQVTPHEHRLSKYQPRSQIPSPHLPSVYELTVPQTTLQVAPNVPLPSRYHHATPQSAPHVTPRVALPDISGGYPDDSTGMSVL